MDSVFSREPVQVEAGNTPIHDIPSECRIEFLVGATECF